MTTACYSDRVKTDSIRNKYQSSNINMSKQIQLTQPLQPTRDLFEIEEVHQCNRITLSSYDVNEQYILLTCISFSSASTDMT